MGSGRDPEGRLQDQKTLLDLTLGDYDEVVDEFVEDETGPERRSRPALTAAIDACRRNGATLVVPNMHRLFRSQVLLSRVVNSQIEVCFPEDLAGAGPFNRILLRQIELAVRYEATFKVLRAQAAREVAKARGRALGRPSKKPAVTLAIRGKAIHARQLRGVSKAMRVKPMIDKLRDQGCTTLQQLADALTRRRIRTPRGRQKWTPTQVWRLLQYYDGPKQHLQKPLLAKQRRDRRRAKSEPL